MELNIAKGLVEVKMLLARKAARTNFSIITRAGRSSSRRWFSLIKLQKEDNFLSRHHTCERGV